MSIINDTTTELFKKYYPDIEINSIDKELLSDMLFGIFQQIKSSQTQKNLSEFIKKEVDKEDSDLDSDSDTENNKDEIVKNIIKTNDLIEENFLMANNLIPEMIVPTELIYLKGKIAGLPINILLDTGAQSSTSFKSVTDKANIDYLIDKQSKSYTVGVNNISLSYGTLWYIELELEISHERYVSVPISLNIDDDTEKNKKIKEINEEQEIKIDLDKKIDMLLGINFLKAYKAKIDFSRRTITLNDSIIINYR